MGKKSGQQIIDKHLVEKGRYPNKVAVVLWATETIRNGGINESTILYLLGLAPKWDRTARITEYDKYTTDCTGGIWHHRAGHERHTAISMHK
jgi:cobaltochelatase CobN